MSSAMPYEVDTEVLLSCDPPTALFLITCPVHPPANAPLPPQLSFPTCLSSSPLLLILHTHPSSSPNPLLSLPILLSHHYALLPEPMSHHSVIKSRSGLSVSPLSLPMLPRHPNMIPSSPAERQAFCIAFLSRRHHVRSCESYWRRRPSQSQADVHPPTSTTKSPLS